MAKYSCSNSVFLAVIFVAAGFAASSYNSHREDLDPPDPTEPLPPSDSPLGLYYNAAVSSNCRPCPEAGRDVMLDGGNAVDAAIAVLFCEGVACLQSMGLGGGFFMTIYNRTTGEVITLNARETAPAAATEDMFEGDAELSQMGGLSIAVPGELKGYWEAYKRFGTLPWSRLIEPAIRVCEEGLVVNHYVASKLKAKEQQILASETVREILIDPATGSVYEEGDVIFRPGLAQTLKIIAAEGGETLYTGSLAQSFVNDIQTSGGIITTEDMANYRVRWEEPVVSNLEGGLTAFSSTAPSSGPILAFILNILDGFLPATDDATYHQRVTEAFKWAYGQRTRLGDPEFVDLDNLLSNLTSKGFAIQVRDKIFDTQTSDDPAYYGALTDGGESHGTAHSSIIAPDGSAVSVTSTINGIFGAMVRSRSTDIFLNNQMDDFSSPNITNMFGLPPSPENFILPGKRPVSSMCPTIVVNADGDVRLVIGASGGSKITTSVALAMLRNLWLNETIKEAIDAPRFHHQLFPMSIEYEYGILQDVVSGLDIIGHILSRDPTGLGSSVTSLAKYPGYIHANSDYRRMPSIAGF